mmetsp:Transcript_154543/g.284825  ORF Transcript_154543/g.284825 Transcript_154543/m.284825 type:complete len:80 (+) Transcript_154543:3168-3407(+)
MRTFLPGGRVMKMFDSETHGKTRCLDPAHCDHETLVTGVLVHSGQLSSTTALLAGRMAKPAPTYQRVYRFCAIDSLKLL